MKIIIPTYRRTGTQATYKQLPEEWKRRTTFVVDEYDANILKSFLTFRDAEIAIVPNTITSIAQKRKWILENIECKSMVMFDDDLQFAIRRYKKRDSGEGISAETFWADEENPNYFFSQCKPELAETDYWLKELEKMLEQYAHAGFSARQFNNNKPYGWQHNFRMMYSLGYQPAILKKECELGRIETREDMDVTLQLLKKGYENVVCNEFCHDQIYNATGGCSLQRKLEDSNADCDKLAELHPGLVRVTEKDYKRSMRRKEVVCAWKKAYQPR